MRRPLLLLTCAVAALAGVSRTFFEQLPDVLTSIPWRTAAIPVSHSQCAALCGRVHYVYCTGYTYGAGGTCTMHATWCWATEPRDAQPGLVSYSRPTAHVWPCQNGGLALNGKCYFHRHSGTALTWDAAQLMCAQVLGACSRLAQPRDRLTYEFLLRFGRPNDNEWLGASDDDGNGVLTNLDGSVPTWQPALVSHAAAGPVLLPVGLTREIHRTTPTHSAIHRYVCEAPHVCRLREPCPSGWVQLHGGCYQLFTESMTWDAANAHCAAQGSGGRLADIDNNVWHILWEAFFGSSGGRVWLGMRDVEIEGHWVNIYNQTVHITWSGGQPDNGGGVEDCVEMIGNLGNDITCTSSRQFVCRVNHIPC